MSLTSPDINQKIKTFENAELAAKVAADSINEILLEKKGQKVLLLLSGGSAKKVVEKIDPEFVDQNTTITVADDRFSLEERYSNFKEMSGTSFFKKAVENGAEIIPTVPTPNDDNTSYTQRFAEALAGHEGAYKLAIMGIGNAAHTAGIFPTNTTEKFSEIYEGKLIAYHEQDFKAPRERMTITPKYIQQLDKIIMFSVGEDKKPEIEKAINPSTKDFEGPASVAYNHPEATLYTDQTIK